MASSPAASENEFDISTALFARTDTKGKNGHEGSDAVDDFPSFGLDDDDDDDDGDAQFIAAKQAGANRKASNVKGRSVKKGGGFQSMGLDAPLLKAITRKGFSVPTPIQRKTIPLLLDRQDVVGMARTGSGKTAAFVVPMIQRLKAHSSKVGARAAILSPSRELALQTLKVVKELGRGTDLRTVLVVGGESLEDQFSAMTSNPDIIIATPGRFLHLKVEMRLDLSSLKYIVFDEADRLFEMGFAAQLSEILHGLPTSRQTSLFSATLPKSLVEFARAGLQEPKLVRLDADSKISTDLESAFFMVKSAEKDAALLYILEHIIKLPYGSNPSAGGGEQNLLKERKRKRPGAPHIIQHTPSTQSTIVFAATKHHVDYLASLLQLAGYAVSFVYGSLDQTARKIQVDDFRGGVTSILVVTDVAARGIDIPVLANVINYDFPSQPKIFVHRVGRTARAGRKGWSYSLVRDSDVPYMLDLQLFLGRRMILGRDTEVTANFASDMVIGALPRHDVAPSIELINKLLEEDADLIALQIVAGKGEKLYVRTRNSASAESAKRSREVLSDPRAAEVNLLLSDSTSNDAVSARDSMLARVSGFRPQESIFEIGKRGPGHETADLMRKTRQKLDERRAVPIRETRKDDETSQVAATESNLKISGELSTSHELVDNADMGSASEDDLEITFSNTGKNNNNKKRTDSKSWQDAEHFISYAPRESIIAEERAYGVHSGGNSTSQHFLTQARDATMDMANDEAMGFAEPSRAAGMRWDKRSKNYVSRANDEDGSKGRSSRLVRGESGQKIAASFRSGRFDAWRKAQHMGRMPRVGDAENAGSKQRSKDLQAKHFRHRNEKAPKEADRYRDDYYTRKKRVDEAREKRVGRFSEGGGKSELKSVDDMRKNRKLVERRRDKNARPTGKRKARR